MKEFDLLKWRVKNGVHFLRPYTALDIEVLRILNDRIIHWIGACRPDFLGHARYSNTYNVGVEEYSMPAPLLTKVNLMSEKKFFLMDVSSGMFQQYDENNYQTSLKDFGGEYKKFQSGKDCGITVLPAGTGMTVMDNAMHCYSRNKDKLLFKDDLRRCLESEIDRVLFLARITEKVMCAVITNNVIYRLKNQGREK